MGTVCGSSSVSAAWQLCDHLMTYLIGRDRCSLRHQRTSGSGGSGVAAAAAEQESLSPPPTVRLGIFCHLVGPVLRVRLPMNITYITALRLPSSPTNPHN
jgi:hypothetical protein